jgi:hypothetical protein
MFIVFFTDDVKLEKISFLQLKYKTYSMVMKTASKCFLSYVLTRRYLVMKLTNESSPASAFTSSLV